MKVVDNGATEKVQILAHGRTSIGRNTWRVSPLAGEHDRVPSLESSPNAQKAAGRVRLHLRQLTMMLVVKLRKDFAQEEDKRDISLAAQPRAIPG